MELVTDGKSGATKWKTRNTTMIDINGAYNEKLETVNELFEVLSMYVGRVLKITTPPHPGKKSDDTWTLTVYPKAKRYNVGTLERLRFFDLSSSANSIVVVLKGDYKNEKANLDYTYHVLQETGWKLIHLGLESYDKDDDYPTYQ